MREANDTVTTTLRTAIVPSRTIASSSVVAGW